MLYVCILPLQKQVTTAQKMTSLGPFILGDNVNMSPSFGMNMPSSGLAFNPNELPRMLGSQFPQASYGEFNAGAKGFNTGINQSNYSWVIANIIMRLTKRAGKDQVTSELPV